MIKFNKRYINIISLIISLIIIFLLNQIIKSKDFNPENQINDQINNQIVESTAITKSEENTKVASTIEKSEWTIEIPKINLIAQIAEGTSKEVMDLFVGHFEDTPKESGNIGLIAHNRGYEVNYFQNLKDLKEGDEIIYKYNGIKKKFYVKLLKIINDTDWTLLENTKENKLTLITCVENQPEYRRCVQAEQIN